MLLPGCFLKGQLSFSLLEIVSSIKTLILNVFEWGSIFASALMALVKVVKMHDFWNTPKEFHRQNVFSKIRIPRDQIRNGRFLIKICLQWHQKRNFDCQTSGTAHFFTC